METAEVCPRCAAGFALKNESGINIGTILIMFLPLILLILIWFFLFVG